jgi:hypothetical protein
MSTVAVLTLSIVSHLAAQTPSPTSKPVKTAKPAAAKMSARKAVQPAPNAQPEILNNDAVVRMVAAGLEDEIVIAKIKTSKTDFALDADNLIRLKEAKIPQAVLRAMLAKNSGAPAEPEAVAPVIVKDPGPAIPAAPAEPIAPEQVIARQGPTISPLTAKPQKILFIKSEASDVKSAVANIVLSDVGLQLLTMGLSSQMAMWNPYMGDTIIKAANAGKGMILNRGTDTKGFEVETLPGLTADVTLKEGKAEFFVPVNRYIPSADFDPAAVEPVILRIEPRDKDQNRVLSGRKVLLKQEKKGRFDLKPTTDRQESSVEQTIIPVTVERMPDNVIRIATVDDLKRGEYSLVFRKKHPSGVYTSNVALKPELRPAEAAPAAPPAIAGVSPEMMAMLGPEQIAAIQQQQNAQQPPPRGGMFGRLKRPSTPVPDATPVDGALSGFLAWDFRVLP